MTVKGSTRSRAGFVYVLSNEAMPGIVKIGMTQRDPSIRLREINSATGVLPFKLEAAVTTRNAKWTEKAVHQRLAHLRVNDGREFFRITARDARQTVFDVARAQGERAWRPAGSPIDLGRAAGLALALVPLAWSLDQRLAVIWMVLCLMATSLKRPRFVREFLAIGLAWHWLAVAAGASLVASLVIRDAWLAEAMEIIRRLAS